MIHLHHRIVKESHMKKMIKILGAVLLAIVIAAAVLIFKGLNDKRIHM